MIFHFNVIPVFAEKCNFHPFTPSLKGKKVVIIEENIEKRGTAGDSFVPQHFFVV